MENESLSSKVIEQLKEKKITPKPRWEFAVKHAIVWGALVILVIVGSVASSVIIFMIDTNQWDLYFKVKHNPLAFALAALPYFWLIFLGVLLVAIYHYFQQTKSGYKYQAYAVVIAGFSVSMFLGLVFYNSGMAHAIDRIFEKRLPFYGGMFDDRQKFFSQPELGVLPGTIIQIINPRQLILQDIQNNPWEVELDQTIMNCPCFPGSRIIAIGKIETDHNFNAMEIRELRPRYQRPQQFRGYFQLRIFTPAR